MESPKPKQQGAAEDAAVPPWRRIRRLWNGPGSNLCYINSIVHFLIHSARLDAVLRAQPCSCRGDDGECPFVAWSRGAAGPYLRSNVSDEVSMRNFGLWVAKRSGNRFRCGTMHDAAEFLEWLLQEMMTHAGSHVPQHAFMSWRDALFQICGTQGRREDAAERTLLHGIYAFPLLEAAAAPTHDDEGAQLFYQALERSEGSDSCASCLQGADDVMVHIVWHQARPSAAELTTWYCHVMDDVVPTSPDPDGGTTQRKLLRVSCIVAYRGQHYMTLIRCEEGLEEVWALLNDGRRILIVGRSWVEVARWLFHSGLVPQLVRYSTRPATASAGTLVTGTTPTRPAVAYLHQRPPLPKTDQSFSTPTSTLDRWLGNAQPTSLLPLQKRSRSEDSAICVDGDDDDNAITAMPQHSADLDGTHRSSNDVKESEALSVLKVAFATSLTEDTIRQTFARCGGDAEKTVQNLNLLAAQVATAPGDGRQLTSDQHHVPTAVPRAAFLPASPRPFGVPARMKGASTVTAAPLAGKTFILFVPLEKVQRLGAILKDLGATVKKGRDEGRQMGTYVILDCAMLSMWAHKGRLHSIEGFAATTDVYRNFIKSETLVDRLLVRDRSAAELLSDSSFSLEYNYICRLLDLSATLAAGRVNVLPKQ